MDNFKINQLAWMVVIFLSAAAFRLSYMDLIEFKVDEARDVFEMAKFFKDPYFIFQGTIQSTGVYNPPLWYYILVLISLPSRDPQYISMMIALINCIAVVGFYFMMRRWYGNAASVIAALFLAFSPWAILFSRKIWAPDLIIPLVVPLLYFLHRFYIDQDKKSIVWVVVFAGLLIQLHASGIFLAAAIAITIILTRKKINLANGGLGLALASIPLLPYVVYQIANGCPGCQAFVNYQQEAKLFDANALLRPFQFINGSSFDIVLGGDYVNFSSDYPVVTFLGIVFLLEIVFGFVGMILIASKERRLLFLAYIVGVVMLAYLLTKTPARIYYFLIVAPIMFLLYSRALFIVFSGLKSKFVLGAVGSAAVLIVAMNIIFENSFYSFLNQTQVVMGDYGPVFKVTKQLADRYRSDSDDNSSNFIYKKSMVYLQLAIYYVKVGHDKIRALNPPAKLPNSL